MDLMPMPAGMFVFPLLFMAASLAVTFAVVYFAARLAIRHELRRKAHPAS